ncbi:serine-repeat antigen, partial [Plasmodium ovale curtisi]
PKSNWVNLWTGIKLLDYVPTPNSVGTKGYTAYESEKFKGNMDSFIKKVKSEIKNKGSVIAYVRAENALSYDTNGGKIHKLCGSENPDHAVNIVGYGNYISADGKKKSYWIVRNSWGENWGDNGNFKVDMDTPAECKHNFVHTAAVFNLDLPIVEKPVKAEAELYNYYLKSSPDFYSNLYYKNYSKAKNGVVNNGSVSAQSDSVYGQATEQTQASPTSEAAQVLELGGARGVLGGDTSTELNQGESSGGKSLELSKDASGAPSGGALTGETSTGGASVAQDGAGTSEKEESASDPKKVEVVHILKYIKNNKIQSSLIKYDYEYGLGDHACSRSHAIDPEKQDECISFCNDKWDDCKRTISPGYCLTKLKGTNEYTVLSKHIVKCENNNINQSNGGLGSASLSQPVQSAQSQGTGHNGGGEESNTVSNQNSQGGGGGQGGLSPGLVSGTTPKVTHVESALLKDHKGIMVTGPCKQNFLVFLLPHIFIEVDTENDTVQMGNDLKFLSDAINLSSGKKSKNKCTSVNSTNDSSGSNNKTFKFVAYIDDDSLTLIWKVYDASSANTTEDKADVKKFFIRNVQGPITAIQVHNVVSHDETDYFESKNYSISKDIPAKCDLIASNCFLSGSIYIEKCYKCTLQVKDVDPSDVCYNYVQKVESTPISDSTTSPQGNSGQAGSISEHSSSSEQAASPGQHVSVQPENNTGDVSTTHTGSTTQSHTTEAEASTEEIVSLQRNIFTAASDENSKEDQLMQFIDSLLKGVYKTGEGNNKELINLEELSSELKEELKTYCNLLKEVDTSGILENYQMGDVTDIFYNLTKLLKAHPDEKKYILQNKMMHPAICMKNVEEWAKNKTGLVLPHLSSNDLEHVKGTYYSEDDMLQNKKIVTEGTSKAGYHGVIDLKPVDMKNAHPSHIADRMYCNEEYCDRWKDKNGCFSKIGASDQGNCATSWIFASKMHLETIKCMKGYDHVSSSALYVANCSEKDVKEKCTVGSNPLEFLNIVNGKKFLPSEANLQYSYAKV